MGFASFQTLQPVEFGRVYGIAFKKFNKAVNFHFYPFFFVCKKSCEKGFELKYLNCDKFIYLHGMYSISI